MTPPDMRTRLLLLMGQAVALGLMMAFLAVPGNSLFLATYGAELIPYVFLAVAAAGVVLSFAISRAQRKWSLLRVTVTLLLSYATIIATTWVSLVAANLSWVTFLLMMMLPLSIPIGFVIVGGQAGRLLDLQQMKAYFPRVVAGFSLGFGVGGLLAASLVRVLGGPRNLLLFDVGVALVFVGLATETGLRFPAQLRSRTNATGPRDPSQPGSGRVVTRIRLVQLIFGYQLLSAAVVQLLNFIVWERAAFRYPDPSELASFLGVYSGIINVVSLSFAVLFAGRLLSGYGIRFGLRLNPGGLIVVLAGCLIAGFLSGIASLSFFVLICAAQVTNFALQDSASRPSINATYQPLPPILRWRAQTLVEGAGVPLALGCVGGLLLLFQALDLDVLPLTACVTLIAIGWFALSWPAYRAYGRDLRRAFARRDWDPIALQVEDEASQAVLARLMKSDDIRDVRLGLDVLTDAVSPHLRHYVPALIADPDPERRRLGIEAAARLADPALVPLLLAQGRDDAVPRDLRVLALRTASVLGATSAQLEPALADPEVTVRLVASALVAQSGGPSAQSARELCLEALRSGDGVVLEAGLAAVASAPDPQYARAVLAVAGNLIAPRRLDRALAAHVHHLGLDAPAVVDLKTRSPQAANRLIAALGHSSHGSSEPLLAQLLFANDRDIAGAAGEALRGSGFSLAPAAAAETTAAEIARAGRAAAAASTFARSRSAVHLVRALDDDVAECAKRVRCALGLAHDRHWLDRAILHLGSGVDGRKALAMETLEVDLGRRTSRSAVALLEPGVDPLDRRDRLALLDATPPKNPEEWLIEFLDDASGYWQDNWLRACALHATAEILPQGTADLAQRLLHHPDATVSETARWLLDTHPESARLASSGG